MLNPQNTKSIYFERMLEKQNMVTSYKAYWLKGIILEVIENQTSVISFSRLVTRMIVEAWYPQIQFKLNFGHQDQLGNVVQYLEATYHFGPDIKKAALLDQLYHWEVIAGDKIYQRMKKNFYQMVPYRLINPFFADETKGIKDQKKNRLITQLALNSNNVFYHIDEASKTIIIGDDWVRYIMENQAVILGWLQHKLTGYLQNKNLSVPNILMKLEPPQVRDLTMAKKYWKEVILRNPIKEIYSGITMNPDSYRDNGSMSIDHFVPWSFVLHDELWNLAPVFRNTNSSKGNRLPDLTQYFDEFGRLQYEAFLTMRQVKTKRKLMEDYVQLGGRLSSMEILNPDVEVSDEAFISTIKEAIVPIHQLAYNQGYDVWRYGL